MKKVIISMLAAIFITVILPLAIAELSRPKTNADSTLPQPTPTENVSGDA